MVNLKELSERLFSLIIFRNLLNDEAVKKFLTMLSFDKSRNDTFSSYADFMSTLFNSTDCLTDYVKNIVFDDENSFILKAGKGNLTENYEIALDSELDTLNELSHITSSAVKKFLGISESLPNWSVKDFDLKSAYLDRVLNIGKTGYGIFAKYHMFVIKDNNIVPVKYPDNQKLSDFSGYELQRNKIIANTKALLSGRPCNNVLLYGDAGSGKSSSVKAIANEFKGDGLRLIEVKKNQLYSLPCIMDRLSDNPLKFIIFIDDLSFSRNDADFGALKAILEGSVNSRGKNTVIYATSNRRHLVKESLSDRDGDDLHLQDTIQELTSLSARFGLQITFLQPDKTLFSDIVCDLAKKYGIKMPPDELITKAEAHAVRSGGRSPRTAKQFIEYLSYTEEKTNN